MPWLKKLTEDLTAIIFLTTNAALDFTCWVQRYNFIETRFRFMMRGHIDWISTWETALTNEFNELEKVSVRRFQTSENSLSSTNEILLVFWCCSEIFCRFWPRFCINYFNDLQNYKHEKRLETEVSSLRNPVIMREIKLRLTFGDRCSTNWAIPLNIWSLQMNTCHLQEIS